MRVGFYYSLMDWHHADGARCATDPEARKRFVEYTHGLIRELMTNYGKIDILWTDDPTPLNRDTLESERMNEMVFALQPDIVMNNRNGLEGDFSTPEQRIEAPAAGHSWETCMTLNNSWGFNRGDDYGDSYVRVLDHGWHVGAIGVSDHHGADWGSPTLPRAGVLASAVPVLGTAWL